MTPSQEAREYPPLPEADAWPLGPAVPFFGPEKMRSYVESDRKARQQDAQRLIDAIDKLGSARVFLRGWQGSDHCRRNAMVEEVGRWIDGISELYRLAADARAAIAKGEQSHE